MKARARFDLDGIALSAEGDSPMVIAILRRRTTAGLELLMPESGDFTVPWAHVNSAEVDLVQGTIRVSFESTYAKGENWLRGATVLVGRWTDRFTMGAG